MRERNILRRRHIVAGQVQGVGFRPFVYRLAAREGLSGTVGNTQDGVRIEVQGTPHAVEAFSRALRTECPPLARIVACTAEDIPPLPEEQDFHIVPSQGGTGHSVLVSPDMGICPDCLQDMRSGRRRHYAFTNCTNCGPRYTITRAIPYDRATTSMACFPFCPDCAAEYGNPLDRRFHAQPNACPACGPRLWLAEAGAQDTACPPADGAAREALAQSSLARAAALLHNGGIVAVKGLGGFLLACDAYNDAAVARLRQRKQRPHKPFAVMAEHLDAARRLARLTPEAEALLSSPEKPIVLCRKRQGPDALPDAIAPDVPQVGIMLPYAPLHEVLFEHYRQLRHDSRPAVLVMTSGNAGGEPICLGNREALGTLSGMADAFLLHDRDILVRVDDSVLAIQEDRPDGSGGTSSAPSLLFFRRARGYVPRPVFLPHADDAPCVLGCGPELKATLCLTRGDEAFVSQHLGDLHNMESFRFFEEVARHLESLLQVTPQALVCDAHPDFMATRYAQARAAESGLPCIPLQHHAAHGASVLAENHVTGPALVLALDGTGMGTDGTIWGGELLYMNLSMPAWQRLGRLSPFPLPGGDAAVREPWRIAQALLWSVDALAGSQGSTFQPPWLTTRASRLPLLRQMLEKNINSPLTSSCGRLFDATAALLGLCEETTYEGQAAIRLEAALPEDADWRQVRPLDWRIREDMQAWAACRTACGAQAAVPSRTEQPAAPPLELDSLRLFDAALDAVRRGCTVAQVAASFHLGLAQGLADMAARAARQLGLTQVGLSGGVMQNATLSTLLRTALQARGLRPLTHHDLPAGDGGLSLGQAAWGRAWLARQGRRQRIAG